jgi:TusA-related sulfurtransferase
VLTGSFEYNTIITIGLIENVSIGGSLPTLKPDKKLDCTGFISRVPLIKTRKVLDTMEAGDVLEVLAGDPDAEKDIKSLVKKAGHVLVKFEKKEAHLRFLIMKTSRGGESV